MKNEEKTLGHAVGVTGRATIVCELGCEVIYGDVSATQKQYDRIITFVDSTQGVFVVQENGFVEGDAGRAKT